VRTPRPDGGCHHGHVSFHELAPGGGQMFACGELSACERHHVLKLVAVMRT
jgi:hypothetical protein